MDKREKSVYFRVGKLRGESLRGARRKPRRAAAAVIFWGVCAAWKKYTEYRLDKQVIILEIYAVDLKNVRTFRFYVKTVASL